MLPPSEIALYWSLAGDVTCAAHPPQPDTPEWAKDRWRPLPPSAQGNVGVFYGCHTCSPDHSAVTRLGETSPTNERDEPK